MISESGRSRPGATAHVPLQCISSARAERWRGTQPRDKTGRRVAEGRHKSAASWRRSTSTEQPNGPGRGWPRCCTVCALGAINRGAVTNNRCGQPPLILGGVADHHTSASRATPHHHSGRPKTTPGVIREWRASSVSRRYGAVTDGATSAGARVTPPPQACSAGHGPFDAHWGNLWQCTPAGRADTPPYIQR